MQSSTTNTTSSTHAIGRCLIAMAMSLTALATGGCVSMEGIASAIEAANQQRADRGYQNQDRYQDQHQDQYESEPASRYYQLVQQSGLCLDVHAPDVRRNGAKVQTWQCTGGDNQAFEFVDNALVTPEGMCLDVDGHARTKNGGRVQIWKCEGNVNQRWYYSPSNGQLVNEAGLCLDADGHSRGRNGGKVQVWQCQNNHNQQWFAEPY